MRVLALDTTGPFGSITLLGEDGPQTTVLHSPEGFSATLFDHIRLALERASWKLGEVDAFAAAAGPGSFTGVRVGLAAVKGLAEACAKPAYAISNLQALAACGSHPLRAVFMDARRGEIYGAVYDAALEPVAPEVVAKFPAWVASLPAGDLEFLSSDLGPFTAALAEPRFAGFSASEHRALSGPVARIASERLKSKDLPDPAALDANYVRRSDAELFWREH